MAYLGRAIGRAMLPVMDIIEENTTLKRGSKKRYKDLHKANSELHDCEESGRQH